MGSLVQSSSVIRLGWLVGTPWPGYCLSWQPCRLIRCFLTMGGSNMSWRARSTASQVGRISQSHREDLAMMYQKINIKNVLNQKIQQAFMTLQLKTLRN